MRVSFAASIRLLFSWMLICAFMSVSKIPDKYPVTPRKSKSFVTFEKKKCYGKLESFQIYWEIRKGDDTAVD